MELNHYLLFFNIWIKSLIPIPIVIGTTPKEKGTEKEKKNGYLNKTAFLLFIITQTTIVAQVSPPLDPSSAFINKELIKKNRIKMLVRNISDKPDNKAIEDKGLVEVYKFDINGQLLSSYSTEIKSAEAAEINGYTTNRKGKRIPYTKIEKRYLYDTTFTFYGYNENNSVKYIRQSIIGRDVFKTKYFEYDSRGSITKETVVREVNVAEDVTDFKMGMQTILSTESYSYEVVSSTQLKKKFLNDENRPYKEGIIYLDAQKNVVEEKYRFIISSIQEQTLYKYNTEGKLIETNYFDNNGGEQRSSVQYDYTKDGLINAKTLFKETTKTNYINFLYDSSSKLLQSEVNRDYKNASIGIVKYSYYYW